MFHLFKKLKKDYIYKKRVRQIKDIICNNDILDMYQLLDFLLNDDLVELYDLVCSNYTFFERYITKLNKEVHL